MDAGNVLLRSKKKATIFFVQDVRRDPVLVSQSKIIFVQLLFLLLICCVIKVALSWSRLQIHYTVEDQIGTVSAIFWDKLATQLLGKTAVELKQLLKSVRNLSKVCVFWLIGFLFYFVRYEHNLFV